MCPNLGKDTLFETEEDYQEPDGITAKVAIYGDSFSHPGVKKPLSSGGNKGLPIAGGGPASLKSAVHLTLPRGEERSRARLGLLGQL